MFFADDLSIVFSQDMKLPMEHKIESPVNIFKAANFGIDIVRFFKLPQTSLHGVQT